LDKSALNKIVESLQKSSLAEGKKLLVSNKVKPDILGGIMVEIGDKSIDLTVSAKLAKLNKLITGKYNCILMLLLSNLLFDP
jgi:F-type H+-transporting ATPase subunit O